MFKLPLHCCPARAGRVALVGAGFPARATGSLGGGGVGGRKTELEKPRGARLLSGV